MSTTVRALLTQSARLEPASDSPLLDAQLLLAHTLGCNRASVMANDARLVTAQQQIDFEAAMTRRQRGEPLAYILGCKGFWDFELLVDARVLVPRPETELLVERALALLDVRAEEPLSLLDLGTGSGAIALALARSSKAWSVTATDIDGDSLALARVNAHRLEVSSIEFVESDWFSALADRRFDVIVSNPPYVAPDDPHLQRDGLPFEPDRALVAGHKGLEALTRIVSEARKHLNSRGWLLLEHGFEQADAVGKLLQEAGFGSIRCWQDLAGLDRVTSARAP